MGLEFEYSSAYKVGVCIVHVGDLPEGQRNCGRGL